MASSPEGERRERLRMLVDENARRRHRPKLLEELAGTIGREPSLDDFLSLQAAEVLQSAVIDQARFHLVTHRIWGDRLAGEGAVTLRAIGDRLRDDEAYLLLRDPMEAVLVPVSAVLRHTAAHLSQRSGVTLVTAEADSGLVLTWDHLAYADEYSLLTWGRFAFDLGE
jgi:hypothetical protein